MSLFSTGQFETRFNAAGQTNSTFFPGVSFNKPPVYLSNYSLDEDETEKQRITQYIQDQQEQGLIRQGEFVQNDKERRTKELDLYTDALREAIKQNPNQKNIDIENEAKISFNEELALNDFALSVSLIADKKPGEAILPKYFASSNSNIRELTFRSASNWGFLLDPKAESPQFNELVSMNGQTLRFFAERMRGGAKGELWENASPYLKEMFKEDPTVKAYLDTMTNISPYFFSWEASTSLPFMRTNPLEILQNAEVPTGPNGEVLWDPKKAIEELKVSNPKIAYALFTQMGIPEERLLDPIVAKNPQTFKFFIADALDTFATGLVLDEFSKQAGFFERNTFKFIYPVIRDSLNSNDTVAEFILIGGGLALTATGVAAVPGVAATAVGVTSKLSSVFKMFSRARSSLTKIERLARVAKTSRTVTKAFLYTTNGVGKAVGFIAPHYVGENLLRLAAKSSKLKNILYTGEKGRETALKLDTMGDLLKKSVWSDFVKAGGLKQEAKVLGRYALRSLISGAGQGAIEDVIRQQNAMATGFKDTFTYTALGQNIVEEAVGELLLGGAMNATMNFSKTFNINAKEKIKFLSIVQKRIKEKNLEIQDAVWTSLSKRTRRNIEYVAGLTLGLNTKSPDVKLTLSQQIDLRFRAYDLMKRNDEIVDIIPDFDFLNPKDNVVETFLKELDNTGVDHRTQLFRIFSAILDKKRDPNTGKTNVTRDDLMSVFMAYTLQESAFHDTEADIKSNKFVGLMWLEWKKRQAQDRRNQGETDLEDPTIEDLASMTDDETDTVVNYLQTLNTRAAVFMYGSADSAPKDANGQMTPLSNPELTYSRDTKTTITETAQEQANQTNQTIEVDDGLGRKIVIKPNKDKVNVTPTAQQVKETSSLEKAKELEKVPSFFKKRDKTDNIWTSDVKFGQANLTFSQDESGLKALKDFIESTYEAGQIANLILVYFEDVSPAKDESVIIRQVLTFKGEETVAFGISLVFQNEQGKPIIAFSDIETTGIEQTSNDERLIGKIGVYAKQEAETAVDTKPKETPVETQPTPTNESIETKEEESVALSANTTIIGLLKKDDEIEFEYSSGTRSGEKRRVRVISVTTDDKGKQTIKALDLEKNEERQYVTSRITGNITFYQKEETVETAPEAAKPPTPPETKPVETTYDAAIASLEILGAVTDGSLNPDDLGSSDAKLDDDLDTDKLCDLE